MSTWIYLECRDHTPALKSRGESGQHLSDLPQIRDDIANRGLIASAVHAGIFDTGDHFRSNTAAFLAEHPRCRLGIRDEYGVEHALIATEGKP